MRKRRSLLLAIAAAAVVGGAGFYFYAGGHNAPHNQQPLVDLTSQSLEAFRADFNRAVDQFRVVLLLSPT